MRQQTKRTCWAVLAWAAFFAPWALVATLWWTAAAHREADCARLVSERSREGERVACLAARQLGHKLPGCAQRKL